MCKKISVKVILLILIIILIILDKSGFSLISRIGLGVFTFVSLVLKLPKIRAMNKGILAIALTINLVTGSALVYAAFFKEDSQYWLFGSMICFLISFPIALVFVEIYRRRNLNKFNL